MVQTGLQFEFEQPRKKIHLAWLLFLILALIFHGLLFLIHFQWAPAIGPPPVDIQQIDPKKLDHIRKQWKEKSLLLDKNPSTPSDQTAPPDARYFSDRNRQVEKEQRARDTNVIPKAGRPEGLSDQSQQPSSPTKAQPHTAPHPLANLGNLGIPFHLNRPINPRDLASQETQNHSTQSRLATPLGGDQAVLDPNLPTGSENLLNTQESIYYSFYARLYEAIGPVWQSRIREIPQRTGLQPREYRTEVDVVLDQSGAVVEVRRISSCGVEELDRAIEEAWRKVGPFPNPPSALLNSSHQIHTGWTFSVNVQQGFGMREAPPVRNY